LPYFPETVSSDILDASDLALPDLVHNALKLYRTEIRIHQRKLLANRKPINL
jgi:hypothetical protein